MIYKILIVDDSRIARMQIKSVFNDENLSISECASGQEAIDKLQENYYHVVLLDLLMPGIDGVGVLKYMQDKNIKTKVIVVTADIQEATKKEVLSLGAYGFINKPPDKLSLQKIMRQALEEAET